MIGKKLTNALLVLSCAIFIFSLGYKYGEYKTKDNIVSRASHTINKLDGKKANTYNIDFGLFWDTWDKIEQKFIDKKKLDPQKMLFGAIKGMVSSLEDPYTLFLTPDENKQAKKDLEGKFEGIGAQLGMKDGRIIVIAPLKDSPAEKAGVKAGDYINKVDGNTTQNWTLPQAVSKIRGPEGTKVTLTLERKGKEFEVNITRKQIKVPSVNLTFERSKIAYLKLSQFGENTNEEWDKAVDEVKNKWQKGEIKGMVLDLRDNPGGYLESAVYLASEFLPFQSLVVKQESSSNYNKEYRVARFGKLTELPLVILINKGSASASEILAGTLRDHKKAVLVGEKTFGKGSVQEAIDLKDGAGLHVTVAKWILPNGDWINSKGIEPDFKVENKIKEGDTLTKENDTQLEKAIEILLK